MMMMITFQSPDNLCDDCICHIKRTPCSDGNPSCRTLEFQNPECCNCVNKCNCTDERHTSRRCYPCSCQIPAYPYQLPALISGKWRCPPTNMNCLMGFYVYNDQWTCIPHCGCGPWFEHKGKRHCPLCNCNYAEGEETCINEVFGRQFKECCNKKCFPSASRVSLENGESVTMSELQVGDKVQTGTGI